MLNNTYAKTLSMIPASVLADIEKNADVSTERFPELLERYRGRIEEYLPDLARLEYALSAAGNGNGPPDAATAISANPTLQIVPVAWKNLHSLVMEDDAGESGAAIEPGNEMLLVWRMPEGDAVRARPALNEDLLAIKIVVEGMDIGRAAGEAGVALPVIERLLDRAAGLGLLVQPPSGIRRNSLRYPGIGRFPREFVESDFFTLQWHITQKCDLHCRHCYDRSDRDSLDMNTAADVLDQLHDFCRAKFVKGQVSFTGGNPLLYSHFSELYREAADRGFYLAILGNPSRPEQLEKIFSIQKPVYYQVSLEGLREYNDYIRGDGHFDRTLEFLGALRGFGVESAVMMTLNRDNLDQALPLAEILRGRADTFTFNRLSRVGEGENLFMADAKRYRDFLEEYLEAASRNDIMGFKDNLFNAVRHQRGKKLGGGCAGYGCGAAFNFVSLLSDGEVHACRKYPSLIGDMRQGSLREIYESETAELYRSGPVSCRNCPVSPVCRGCPAVAFSCGLDPFHDRDPFCFMPE